MSNKWNEFQYEVSSLVQPLLQQAGYTYETGEDTENDGFYIQFSLTGKPSISIFVLPQIVPTPIPSKEINWVRVDIGKIVLKEVTNPSPPSGNMYIDYYQKTGWVYSNQEELEGIMSEIANALSEYLDIKRS